MFLLCDSAEEKSLPAILRPPDRHGNRAGGGGVPTQKDGGACGPLPVYFIIIVTALDGLDWLLILLFRAKSVKLPPNSDNNAFAYFQF